MTESFPVSDRSDLAVRRHDVHIPSIVCSIKRSLFPSVSLITTIMTISEGTYFIVNKKAGNALDLSGGDNRSIIGYDLHNGENQKVRICLDQRKRKSYDDDHSVEA
jgi:hypothetical protein